MATARSSFPINDQWSCPTCSYNNPLAAYPCCEVCEQMHPQVLSDSSVADQPTLIWKCPRCTLHNIIISEQCAACGQAKPTFKQTETVLTNLKTTLLETNTSLLVRTRRKQHETDAENIFRHIISYCKQHKTHFIDDQFVPSDRSIGDGSFGSVSKWLRISEIASLPHDPPKLSWTIFSSPEPSDIKQGVLGNCWLVAALALVSERPRLLEHILLTKEVNSEGVYLVRICHNGLWTTVIVDDLFPCTKHNHLVFTKAKRRQLYVPLIEKACAKVFGSYASLRSGNMLEGLQLLTGAPCDYIDLESLDSTYNRDMIWARLLSACESKLLIGVSSGVTSVSQEEYTRVHIHKNHAFSILVAHTLANSSSRYVLVRDPHSRSYYTEDSITESVLKQLRLIHPAQRSTGAFWISWSRFLRYFSSITISTYDSNHFDIREEGKFTGSATEEVTSYFLHVPQASLVTISLLYHRRHRKIRTNSQTQAFVLCDTDELASSGIVGSRQSILISKRGGFTYWSGSLQAGSYVVIPFSTSFWRNDNKNRNFTIVIHSSVHIDLKIKNKRPTFLADCLIASVIQDSKKKQYNEAAIYVTSSKLGMKLFVAENLSITNYLNINIDMTIAISKSMFNYLTIAINVRHSRCAHLPNKTHDCIPPRHRQLLFITEWIDRNGGSAQLQYSYSSIHDKTMSDSKPPIDRTRHDLHSARAF